MEISYLVDVFSLGSHLQKLYFQAWISHCVYQLGHMGGCLFTGVVSACVGDGDLMFCYLIKISPQLSQG